MLFVACLTSQQHASASQGRVCSDKFTRCHTETEVADQTFYFTQSQNTDIGPTSPSADPIAPGRVATRVPIFKRRHGSGNKRNFENGQNKSSFILKHRECNPLFVTMDTRCKLYFKRAILCGYVPATVRRLPSTVSTGMTRPGKILRRKWDSNPESSAPEADALTTRPTRRCPGTGSQTTEHLLQSCSPPPSAPPPPPSMSRSRKGFWPDHTPVARMFYGSLGDLR